jgi:hypothetical protein
VADADAAIKADHRSDHRARRVALHQNPVGSLLGHNPVEQFEQAGGESG